MADYSSLQQGPTAQAITSTQTPVSSQPTQPAQSYQYVEKGHGPSGVAVAALIIAMIVALILLGLFVWVWYQGNKTNFNPFWVVTAGVASGTTDSWSPDGNDIYQVKNPASFSLKINASGTSLNGRMFMIDNTANVSTNVVTVVGGTTSGSTPTAVTILDTTGKNFKIDGGTSAQFIWYSNTSVTRLT